MICFDPSRALFAKLEAPEEQPGFGSSDAVEELEHWISEILKPLGYELVAAEVHLSKSKKLVLYIDFIQAPAGVRIGIEDCVRVTRHLDLPLENQPLVDAIFKGASYDLEVSSPGLFRPVRKLQDFVKFQGRFIEIHLYRPLKGDELGHATYAEKNPKQKAFWGLIQGVKGHQKESAQLVLGIHPSGNKMPGYMTDGKSSGKQSKKGQKISQADWLKGLITVTIPLTLISKATLSPEEVDLHSAQAIELEEDFQI